MILWIFDFIALIIAFSISPVVGFAWLIINIVYIVIRIQATRKMERAALSVFEYEENDSPFHTSIKFSFPDMLMLVDSACHDYPGFQTYRLNEVKRDTITGKWYCRHTLESRKKELKYIQAQIIDFEKLRGFTTAVEEYQQKLINTSDNEWVDITDQFCQLEPLYQKWLRDGIRNEIAPEMERWLSKPDK